MAVRSFQFKRSLTELVAHDKQGIKLDFYPVKVNTVKCFGINLTPCLSQDNSYRLRRILNLIIPPFKY